MQPKKVCYSELAYVFGIIALALGTALMERADVGMSMVVAPAYLLHLKLSGYYPAFTFGMAEYALQALLLIALSIAMGGFKRSYLFSFVTAVIYGVALDLAIRGVGFMPFGGMGARMLFYFAGMLLCSVGVALLFHTYIAPEAYELVVKEISAKYGRRADRVKTAYDCASCLISVALSFAFFGFGRFECVKLGTIFCALMNGWLIGRAGRALEAVFIFRDALELRRVFSR